MCLEGITVNGGRELQKVKFKEKKELDTHTEKVNFSAYFSTHAIGYTEKA